jgi:hypothetical protein
MLKGKLWKGWCNLSIEFKKPEEMTLEEAYKFYEQNKIIIEVNHGTFKIKN